MIDFGIQLVSRGIIGVELSLYVNRTGILRA